MVSVIILSLLRRTHTERCLKCLYDFTELPFETIIVSQESDQECVEWLDNLSHVYSNCRVIYNATNVGTAVGRNQGIAAARGNYVVFLDNDATVTPGWINPLIRTIESNDYIAAVAPMVLTSDGRVQYCSHYMVERKGSDAKDSIGISFDRSLQESSKEIADEREVPWYPTTCLLTRRTVLEEINGFDANFHIGEEDKDISLTMRRKGYTIMYNPASRIIHDSSTQAGSYSKIRGDVKRLFKDIQHFETKWQCKVLFEFSKTYLREMGYSEDRIEESASFPLFMTVTES